MVSLEELKREGDLHSLKEAIRLGDVRSIIKYLKGLSAPLPLEIAHKLADYLDPDRPTDPTAFTTAIQALIDSEVSLEEAPPTPPQKKPSRTPKSK